MKKFDHEVARNYAIDIRKKVPGYELCHELVESLLNNKRNEKLKILIVGPGTGEEIFELSKLNPSWKFVGVEASLAMAEMSQSFVSENQLQERVEIIHSRLEDYKTDERYDLVLSILVSHFIDYKNKPSFFKDISNLLLSGGEVILFDLFKTSENTHEAWMKWSLEQGLTLEESQQMRLNVKTKFFPLSLEEFKILLGETSLEIQECFLQSLGFQGLILKKD